MRTPPVRALWRGTLALALVSCTADRITAPSGPNGLTRDLAGGASTLVISEFMSDPAKVTDANGEWVEIYNPGPDAVDLQGYKLASGPAVLLAGGNPAERHAIATSVVVPAGGYVVLGNNANSATNGGVPEDYSYGTSITLNNSNTDWLTLKDPTGALLDSVAYSASTVSGTTRTIGTPAFTPSAGTSRGVVDQTADNAVAAGANWINSASTYGAGDRGTPGQPNVGGPAAKVTVRISWVTPGTSFRVSASAVDKDGKPSATNFTWASSDTTIARIDPATGNATGVAPGVATVTATATNGVSGDAPLFVVNPGDVASVSLSINDPQETPAGYTKPIFPTTRTTTSATVTPTLVWSSSDPGVATVSDLGYITAVAPGTLTIRATAPNGVYGEVPYTIVDADAPTTAVYRNHVEFGQPTPGGAAADRLLAKRQYVLSYNPQRGGANWVSWDLNATQFGGAVRCECFSADQSLPGDVYRVTDFDYRNGGYDRGHMVQSESRTTTAQENAATFLLTNILPQAAANNQGPWSKLENALNDSARLAGREVYVVAGGIYRSGAPTLKNEGKVAIPDYTWKVAVIMPGGKGLADVHSLADLQVIAVKIPNLTGADAAAGDPAYAGTGTADNATIHGRPWQDYATTVDAIEAATGYDLLAKLPDAIEIPLEASEKPPVADIGGPYPAVVEGSALQFDASRSTDPDADDVLAYAWDFGDGTTGAGVAPVHAYADNGSYLVTLTVTDKAGAPSTATTQVSVTNAAPVITAVSTTLEPIALGTAAHVTVLFGDAGTADSHTLTVNWDDGSVESFAAGQVAGASSHSASASHTYAQPGVYTIGVTVRDDDGAQAAQTSTHYSVVYDPSGGFATGGGWITSPAGAYANDRSLTGKASFGFVARYERGATTPSGNTEFQFHQGSLEFSSTSYDWLVVNPGMAQYKGKGTLKGLSGVYNFFLTAIDGEQRGGQADRFRIRITDAQDNPVYDNGLGAGEDSDASTALEGGNVSVKTR